MSNQKPSAQTIPSSCLNNCINAYNNLYANALGSYNTTVRDMLWKVSNTIGNAWYGYFLDFWQGVFQIGGVLEAYDSFRTNLYTAEENYFHQVGEAATDYNQCLGGCSF